MVEISIAKQNYSIESENALNQQIQIDQIAQQQYLSTAAYFDRDDVALPGLVKHFLEQAEHEGERVQSFIDYQQMRGGIALVKEVPQPMSEYASARSAVEASLALEKDVNKSLLNLTSIALNSTDSQMKHWLKSNALTQRVKNIEKVAKGITQLERTHGEGLGLYLYDQAILKNDGEFTV
ncbi:ferritin-like superfamily [Phascolomyces articulosus]|uniref:Ferritin n=1 Tax=Phascolomyces articulosus TaxID=60185 RepID=A0AAD5PJJ7_9FUNG|nr:ferritin-like superfamily [Phascolomyces articulosus]